MNSITCSKCELSLVKSLKYEPNKELLIICNVKCMALCYNELLTSEPVMYHFSIYHNCKSALFQNNKDESKGRSSRRRYWIN